MIANEGLFAGSLPGRHTMFRYRLRVTLGTNVSDIEDPYRFGPILSDLDLYLFGEGNTPPAVSSASARIRSRSTASPA